MNLFILIPLFILVILPSIGIVSEILFIQLSLNFPFYGTYFEYTTVIIVMIYGFLSYSQTTRRYDTKRWMENLVIEHEFLKILLYISIPILIIVLVIFQRYYQPEGENFTYPLLFGMILIVGGTILRFISNISKRNFRFYYARACLQLSLKKTDEAEKMNMLVRALNSYNKYLKRILKLHMKNIDEICSKIISDSHIDKGEFTNSMNLDFQSDDKLKPITRISKLLNLENPQQFLSKESLWEKIKDWVALLAAIIPVVIAIIQFGFTSFSRPPG